MPRLGFTKSRNGCLKCKQRRIKCDENAPCGACVKHGIKCSLLNAARRQASLTAGDSPSADSRSSAPHGDDDASPPAEADPFSYFTNFNVKQQHRESDAQWMTDLGLMHHFSTVTWETLPEGARRQKIWQAALPRLAAGYDFLMHQVLALAACHLAFLSAERHSPHSIQATQHQGNAIQGLRRVIPHMNESNCHAIFAATSLLPISAFAAQAENIAKGEPGPGLDDLLEVFSLMRGMSSILKNWEEVIASGPLGQLLRLGDHVCETPLLAGIVRSLEGFNDLDEVKSLEPSTRRLFEAEAATFTSCVDYATKSAKVPELRVATMLPIYFTDDFFDLLRQRHCVAISMFKLYAQVLEAAGQVNWYMRGWGKCILESLEKGGHAS